MNQAGDMADSAVKESTEAEFLAAMKAASHQQRCIVEKDMDEVLIGNIVTMHDRNGGFIRVKRPDGTVMAWRRLA
jgi:hypothetical protein